MESQLTTHNRRVGGRGPGTTGTAAAADHVEVSANCRHLLPAFGINRTSTSWQRSTCFVESNQAGR